MGWKFFFLDLTSESWWFSKKLLRFLKKVYFLHSNFYVNTGLILSFVPSVDNLKLVELVSTEKCLLWHLHQSHAGPKHPWSASMTDVLRHSNSYLSGTTGSILSVEIRTESCTFVEEDLVQKYFTLTNASDFW